MKEKVIASELVIKSRRRNEEHTSKYEARLTLNEDTTVGQIVEFTDEMKKIWNKAVQAAKNCENVTDIEMDIHEAVYKHAPGEDYTSMSFDRWYLRALDDISTEKGEEYIYLCPDIKYTPAERDMALGRDVMRDMAFTMR